MKKKSLRRIILPLAIAIFLMVWCEFLLSNYDNTERLNSKIEEIIGIDPDFESIPETILPRPSKVWRTFIRTPKNGRGGPLYYWEHTKATLFGAGYGFVFGNLLAIIMATLFLYCKPLERALMPFALTLKSVPMVALTPLLLRIRISLANMESLKEHEILYNFVASEGTTKVFIVIVLMFFPTLVNVAQGLNSVPTQAMELMRTYNASKWQIYWKLRVPYALPMTFAALKIATSNAVMGVVVAEWLSSSEGLGYVIYRGYGLSQVSLMMVALIISCLLSACSFLLLGFLEKIVIPWQNEIENSADEKQDSIVH